MIIGIIGFIIAIMSLCCMIIIISYLVFSDFFENKHHNEHKED